MRSVVRAGTGASSVRATRPGGAGRVVPGRGRDRPEAVPFRTLRRSGGT